MTKWTLVALGAFALAACGQQAQRADTTQPNAYDTAPAPTQTAAITDAEFVAQAVNANAFELQSSDLAAANAGRQDVKVLATDLITAHRAVGEQLTQMATQLNIAAPTPALSASQSAKIEDLRSARGEAFDDAYLDAQVEAHESTVNLFERYVQTANAGPLRDWAQSTLPALRQHLERVQTLENAT